MDFVLVLVESHRITAALLCTVWYFYDTAATFSDENIKRVTKNASEFSSPLS